VVEEAQPKVHSLNLGEGSGEKLGGAGNQQRLWTVKWQSGIVDFYETGKDFTGTLTTVTGTIFNDQGAACTFAGDRSRVDKAKDVLILEGRVRLISVDPKMTLTCDKLRYEAGNKLVKAQGNVRIVGEGGTVSGLQEIWTTPELNLVATPDAFPSGGSPKEPK
jgi:hypothetical protein